jgi:AraC-like DNA-binding protein
VPSASSYGSPTSSGRVAARPLTTNAVDGRPPAVVATESGFYDQSHLTRHLRRMLGTTPTRYATGRSPV